MPQMLQMVLLHALFLEILVRAPEENLTFI